VSNKKQKKKEKKRKKIENVSKQKRKENCVGGGRASSNGSPLLTCLNVYSKFEG
jgi:hypothetical protein